MLTKEQAIQMCDESIVKEMGEKYINKHNGHICISKARSDDDVYFYFAGFRDENKENEEFKGWTVYAYLEVDLKNGKIIYEKIGKPKAEYL